MELDLYIAGKKVQMKDDNLILLNYTYDDLGNIADIKNAYSQSIKIEGTPENDKIFNSAFRLDSEVYAGGYNPISRTPFVIYNQFGQIMQDGYAKLEGITQEDGTHFYDITLYGRFGSIIHNLQFDAEGNKMKLSDLDYLTGGADELDITINKESIKGAWTRIRDFKGVVSNLYDVINFAPCYNGIPDKNFDANKAIVYADQTGNPTEQEGYRTKGRYSIMTFKNKVTEWQAGDLRSYQQRPVISMAGMLQGIKKELAKDGITFIYPKDDRNWMTLPMLTAGKETEESEPVQVEFRQTSGTFAYDNPLAVYEPAIELPLNAKVKGRMVVSIEAAFTQNYGKKLFNNLGNEHFVTFIQGEFEGAGGTCGVSNVGVIGSNAGLDDEVLAQGLGYQPIGTPLTFDHFGTASSEWDNRTGNIYAFPAGVILTFPKSDDAVLSMKLHLHSYRYRLEGNFPEVTGQGFLPFMATQSQSRVQATSMSGKTITRSFEYVTESIVSQTIVTKKKLLSLPHTPAEYLLSYAKVFGYRFVLDSNRNVLEMMERAKYFNRNYPNGMQEKPIDMTGRIDKKSITIKPSGITARYYNFHYRELGSEFEKWYKANYGSIYGEQAVNTGYDYDAKANDVMGKVVFKNAVTSLEYSPYYAFYGSTQTGVSTPPPAIYGGSTYRLWNVQNESKDFPVVIGNFRPVWRNATFNGYDTQGATKMQFHDIGEKPVEGSEVLCYFKGMQGVVGCRLTDDLPQMQVLNNGVPCWNLVFDNVFDNDVVIPIFSHSFGKYSLDFGAPAEVNVPAEVVNPKETIYARKWSKYIADRLSVNSKVISVKVNFAGMQVDEQMLRKFYYFEGCIWQLNRIINYSVTTEDLTECEFVRVQDIDNYVTY